MLSTRRAGPPRAELVRLACFALSTLGALAPAALLTVGEREAHAYCRTVTTPIPASYSPRNGCFKDGLYLFWKNACVSFSVNANATSKVPYDVAAPIIEKSFASWQDATCPSGGGLGLSFTSRSPVDADEVRYNTNGPNQNLVVFREAAWPYNDPNNTLGLTTVTFDANTGEIFDADLEINATGKNLSAGDPVPALGYDLQSVVTHEVGHFLGLAHATDSRATMFASYKPGTTALRSLTADDAEGACAIYPSADVRIVDPQVAGNASGSLAAETCNDDPRHGFGTGNTGPAASSSGDGGGCAVVSPTGGPGAPAGALGLGLGALVAAIRRRRRVM